jgi:hypothetical protein
VKIMELSLLPAGASEDISRSDTRIRLRDVIVQEDGMLDSHRPQNGIRHLRPVDTGMEQHRTSNGHDCTDSSFSCGVVMMGTNTSEAKHLFKGGQPIAEVNRRKGGAIIGLVRLRNHTDISTHLLETLFGFQSLVRVQVCLEFNMNVAGGVVDKDATTIIHVIGVRLAKGTEESPFSAAHKVIDGDALTRNQVVFLSSSLIVPDLC